MTPDLFTDTGSSTMRAKGDLDKMSVAATSPVTYELEVGGQSIDLTPYLGKPVQLKHTGVIHCGYCGVETNKSFQGLCYKHFMSLAQADACMMSPEKCHFDKGTCREPEWGERVCMQTHYVYLANASGLKVGITRGGQIPTRWIDQGATQAIAIARVSSRYLSGLLEVLFKQHVSDKTQWQKMLKGDAEELDMAAERDQLFETCSAQLIELQNTHGIQHIQLISHSDIETFSYPVLNYPEKIKSFNFDKDPLVSGVLQGIKGQYLILDTGVINIRRFSGYEVEFIV